MGSWTETCLASGFPVAEGDEALAFVLARPVDHRPERPAEYRSTPWFLWVPVGFPIRGTYDGFGRLGKVVDDAASRYTLRVLARDLVDPADPSDTGEWFWDTLLGGRGALRGDDMDDCLDRPVSLAFVRADVFEAMVAAYGEPDLPVPGGRPGPYADVASIERNLSLSAIASADPFRAMALASACAPHGDLLDAVHDLGPGAFHAEMARLMAFGGAMRAAGIAYGPRSTGGHEDRWPGVARHHAAMADVLRRTITRT